MQPDLITKFGLHLEGSFEGDRLLLLWVVFALGLLSQPSTIAHCGIGWLSGREQCQTRRKPRVRKLIFAWKTTTARKEGSDRCEKL